MPRIVALVSLAAAIAACNRPASAPAAPHEQPPKQAPTPPARFLGPTAPATTNCLLDVSSQLGDRVASEQSHQELRVALIAETPHSASLRYELARRSFVVQATHSALHVLHDGREAVAKTIAPRADGRECLEFELGPEEADAGPTATAVDRVVTSWAAETTSTWTFCLDAGLVSWRERARIGERGVRELVATCGETAIGTAQP